MACLNALLYADQLQQLQHELLARPSELHLLDRHGDSLMHLAIRRSSVAGVRLLLAAGFDINTRSAGNWTVMEEAMAVAQALAPPHGQADALVVLREVHHATQADEQCRWAERREVVLSALKSMPDFSTVLAWRIGSFMLGISTLLRRFLPSDTYRIRKKGLRVRAPFHPPAWLGSHPPPPPQVRVDSTLAGLDYGSLSWHRGVLSLIIRFDAGPGEPEILMVDHQRRRVAEYLRTWAHLKPDHSLSREATARLLETGLQRETSDQAECALTGHPADKAADERSRDRSNSGRGITRGGRRAQQGGRDAGGGGGVGGSGVRFLSELVPLVPELDLWGQPSADVGAPGGVGSSAKFHCRCVLNVRLRERDGVPATEPGHAAHMATLSAREEASETACQMDSPSDVGDLGLLQQLAKGGKVLGHFTRPASAKVSCSWGLPLSLEHFCVVMRLLAPINRHISGICDYLVGMLPHGAFPTRLAVPLPVSFFVEAHLRSYSRDPAALHAEQFDFDDTEAEAAGAREAEAQHTRASSHQDAPPQRSAFPSVGSMGWHRQTASAADAQFEPPSDFALVGEDVFLDELLDAFLTSLADGMHEGLGEEGEEEGGGEVEGVPRPVRSQTAPGVAHEDAAAIVAATRSDTAP